MCLLLWAELEHVFSWLWLPYFLSFTDMGSACDFRRVLRLLCSSEIEGTGCVVHMGALMGLLLLI
jgi:hypothetical protein